MHAKLGKTVVALFGLVFCAWSGAVHAQGYAGPDQNFTPAERQALESLYSRLTPAQRNTATHVISACASVRQDVIRSYMTYHSDISGIGNSTDSVYGFSFWEYLTRPGFAERGIAHETEMTQNRPDTRTGQFNFDLARYRLCLAQSVVGGSNSAASSTPSHTAPTASTAPITPPPVAAPPPVVAIADDRTRWIPPAVGEGWADRIVRNRASFAFFDMIRHNNTGQSNGRVIHNAAADATSCIQVEQTATRVEWGTEGRMRMVNTCEYAVDVTWCANRTECAAHPWSELYIPSSGNTWQLAPGAEWPIFFTDPRDPYVRLGACRAGAARIPFENLPSATSGPHQPIAAGSAPGVELWDFHHCA